MDRLKADMFPVNNLHRFRDIITCLAEYPTDTLNNPSIRWYPPRR